MLKIAKSNKVYHYEILTLIISQPLVYDIFVTNVLFGF